MLPNRADLQLADAFLVGHVTNSEMAHAGGKWDTSRILAHSRRGRLQDDDVLLLGAPDSAQGNRGIKCDKPPAVPDGERQQVKIGELARSVDARRIGDSRVKKAHVIRPELVVSTRTRFRKAFHDGPHG